MVDLVKSGSSGGKMRGVPCPDCGAGPGEKCVDVEEGYSHLGRLNSHHQPVIEYLKARGMKHVKNGKGT